MLRDRGLRRTSPGDRPPSRCCAGRTPAPCSRARPRRWRRCAPAAGDEVAQAAVRVSTELLALVPVLGRSPLQALARLHALAAAGSLPTSSRPAPRRRGGRAAARAAPACSTPTDGAGPAGGRASCTPTWRRPRRSPRTTGIVARAAERLVLVARGVDPRRRWSSRRPGTSRCGRRTSRTCAATATAGARACTPGCCTPPEAYAAGAEASPLRRAAGEAERPGRASGTRLESSDAAADTRAVATRRALSNCCPGRSRSTSAL